MRCYTCTCNNRLFCDNSLCLACGSELGFCPQCCNLVALVPQPNGLFRCGNPNCSSDLEKCFNYWQHHVCNRCLVPSTAAGEHFCDCCRFNATIPDLSLPGNWQRWVDLEAAKRRLFYELRLLGLPFGTKADGIEPSLAFDFKGDAIPANEQWRPIGNSAKVLTGHNDGLITINIQEADSVEREKLRVNMRESHRTLIGHFRHEIGHFYWDVLVRGRREDECQAVFGDHHRSYDEALQAYYRQGPLPNWQQNYISAYSTMHPWEDFAETWAAYLDMISTLDTVSNVGFRGETDPVHADLDAMVRRLQELTIALNEINRNQGLLDVIPEIYVGPVVDKLRYIHQLVQIGREENGALRPCPAATSAA
jgi:hypothetical protein